MVAEVYVSSGMLAVTSGAWMPLRWVISMVVGEERMLAVFFALSVRTMELRVRVKAASWSEGASVMSTGTVAAGEMMLVAVPGNTEVEHPNTRAASSPKLPATPRIRVVFVV